MFSEDVTLFILGLTVWTIAVFLYGRWTGQIDAYEKRNRDIADIQYRIFSGRWPQ